jgi:hypothetical protein
MEATVSNTPAYVPWNRDKLTGQKSPLKLEEIWAIRIRLQLGAKTRDLAMFNLAIDSKLRACDLTKLRVRDVCIGTRGAKSIRHAAENPAAATIRDHRASRWGCYATGFRKRPTMPLENIDAARPDLKPRIRDFAAAVKAVALDGTLSRDEFSNKVCALADQALDVRPPSRRSLVRAHLMAKRGLALAMLAKMVRLTFEAQTAHPVTDALQVLRGLYGRTRTRYRTASRSDPGAHGGKRSTASTGIRPCQHSNGRRCLPEDRVA